MRSDPRHTKPLRISTESDWSVGQPANLCLLLAVGRARTPITSSAHLSGVPGGRGFCYWRTVVRVGKAPSGAPVGRRKWPKSRAKL